VDRCDENHDDQELIHKEIETEENETMINLDDVSVIIKTFIGSLM
jgi:hypothetical protein